MIFKKSWKNNETAGGAVNLLIILVAYIFIVSLVLSFLLINIYGSNAVLGVNLPTQGQIKIYNQDQNFKNGTFDLETLGKIKGGNWSYIKGVGFQLDGYASSGGYSYLVIDNLEPDVNGLYQNSYWINNTATDIFGKHGDYCILLRATGGADQNEICVTNEGFSIPSSIIDRLLGNDFNYPYSGASQIVYPSIKTIYNDKIPSVEFYFQGSKLFETTKLKPDANIMNWFGRYYGGVGATTLGFVFEDFKTDNLIMFNGETNILEMLSSMILTIVKISTWSIPDWILPVFFVQLFITLPEACILILIAIIAIRGVG
jgi:hypothetical protein